MEIVIGLLILIGALAAGSNASTSEESQAKKSVAQPAKAAIEYGDDATRGPCRFPNGRLVQRNLTVERAPAVPFSSDTGKKAELRCTHE